MSTPITDIEWELSFHRTIRPPAGEPIDGESIDMYWLTTEFRRQSKH